MAMPKRTQVLIPRAFQVRFILMSFVYQLAIVAVFVTALFLPPALRIEDAVLTPAGAWQAGIEFLVLHNRIWPALAVVCGLMLTHALFFSHRIAGPLSRFRRIYQEVEAGNLSVLTSIRREDLLQNEAECLEEMIRVLREKMSVMHRHCRDSAACAERLAWLLERTPQAAAVQELARLRRGLDGLGAELAYFRMPQNAPDASQPVPLDRKAAA